jgi:hypothetical protein
LIDEAERFTGAPDARLELGRPGLRPLVAWERFVEDVREGAVEVSQVLAVGEESVQVVEVEMRPVASAKDSRPFARCRISWT